MPSKRKFCWSRNRSTLPKTKSFILARDSFQMSTLWSQRVGNHNGNFLNNCLINYPIKMEVGMNEGTWEDKVLNTTNLWSMLEPTTFSDMFRLWYPMWRNLTRAQMILPIQSIRFAFSNLFRFRSSTPSSFQTPKFKICLSKGLRISLNFGQKMIPFKEFGMVKKYKDALTM